MLKRFWRACGGLGLNCAGIALALFVIQSTFTTSQFLLNYLLIFSEIAGVLFLSLLAARSLAVGQPGVTKNT
jgi:hypothetical protein